jgi:hypothetical protein
MWNIWIAPCTYECELTSSWHLCKSRSDEVTAMGPDPIKLVPLMGKCGQEISYGEGQIIFKQRNT